MNTFTLDFKAIDQTKHNVVGGKGANLGELAKIETLRVPAGFCITTEAYKRIMAETPAIDNLLDQLALLKPEDRQQIGALSQQIRTAIEETAIPQAIQQAIARALAAFGEHAAWAVRSSATAEDLPTASFAGQQDTYLNIVGEKSILTHVSKCWASLFTERAVAYRLQNGFDHRDVHLAVVVQQMVVAEASGVLFTADPVTANRKVVSIDASFGLGEALVAGLVNPDAYKVRNGVIIGKRLAAKNRAVYGLENGGTHTREIEPARAAMPALTDAQILELAQLGRSIEQHFGAPQDVEWCLANDEFYIVQSRPITTLFPIPEAPDADNRVYVSVGHQQMMTDPIKPLGLSFFLLTTRAPMRTAGGRLFVDVTGGLSSPATREVFLHAFGQSDPLMKDALQTVVERGDFLQPSAEPGRVPASMKDNTGLSAAEIAAQADDNPNVVADLMARQQTSIEALQVAIEQQSGARVFDFIVEDLQQLKQFLFDAKSLALIKSAMDAAAWLNDRMHAWLGEKNAADTLAQSVDHNITSEMGLALLDVADVIRPHRAVVDFLENTNGDDFLEALAALPGGRESRDAIERFLDKFGMRCAGEIDITKPRWQENPAALLPMLINNIRHFGPGAGKQKFEQGRQEALQQAQSLLDRLRQLPDGAQKADDTQRMIAVLRNFSGYREYPKYGMVRRYFAYKQALLREAARLAEARVIREKEDVFYLTFEELRQAVETNFVDYQIIDQRKAEYRRFEKLTPPRVITSDGEIVTGRYNRADLPAGALPGLAVSSGVVEGRARVILNLEDARLEDGDILVTTFTDPSWTPLFVAIRGLVTEVGGLMTHGAVIAREYGLPAVVGVEHATRLIRDGQRIRVHGTDGYVAFVGPTEPVASETANLPV